MGTVLRRAACAAGASALVATAFVGTGAAPAAAETGTCVSIGMFTVSGGVGGCTVLPGETVTVIVKAGNGGAGGIGGFGGVGGDGCFSNTVNPGGVGGIGGAGGLAGAGAKVTGTWTNTTGATVTVSVLMGSDGEEGLAGTDGEGGTDAPCPGTNAGGTSGDGGEAATFGDAGFATRVLLDSLDIDALPGTGGLGGGGGGGGGGGSGAAPASPGNPGGIGTPGLDGAAGQTFMGPLPAGWSFLTTTTAEAPFVSFTGRGIDPVDPVQPSYTG